MTSHPPAKANLDPTAMRDAADRASELLKSLGNRHRLLILCQLAGAERSVGELAAFLGLRDSTVSQHLSLLRKDGLVRTRRDGQTIWYAIASEPAGRVLETLFDVFCRPSTLCAAIGKPGRPATKPRRPAPAHPASAHPASAHPASAHRAGRRGAPASPLSRS